MHSSALERHEALRAGTISEVLRAMQAIAQQAPAMGPKDTRAAADMLRSLTDAHTVLTGTRVDLPPGTHEPRTRERNP